MDQRDRQRSEGQSIHGSVADGRAHDDEGAWKDIGERGSRHSKLSGHTAGQRSAFCDAVKGADSCSRGRAIARPGSASRYWQQGGSVQSIVSEEVRHCAKEARAAKAKGFAAALHGLLDSFQYEAPRLERVDATAMAWLTGPPLIVAF